MHCFPAESFTTECFDGFACRVWKDAPYCAAPVDDIQRLHLYAPACYFEGVSINGYTLNTAPIFLPNTVGGYMPGEPPEAGFDQNGHPNTVLQALMHCYVVACAGIRGRSTKNNAGKAPALIVDMKAAIRYLRHNADVIPGNTERMITSGTSAGGALSALTGASGNAEDYEAYLDDIGAAKERDDVFAANCYCPIINLENADAAYEWQFSQENIYRNWHGQGELSDEQMKLAEQLKTLFPAYVNSLALQDEAGQPLRLNADGSGSLLDAVKRCVMDSAQHELDTHDSAVRLPWLMVPGSHVEEQSFLHIENGMATDLDWDAYIRAITRMKQPPAFDSLHLNTPENDLFATSDGINRHFTIFSHAHSAVGGCMAEEAVIRLLNPMTQLNAPGLTRHWRIRHGAYDRDTSLAIPFLLAAALQMHGCNVDFRFPWGLPHSGEYDLPELFDWIDLLCKKHKYKDR
ncbi:MAG: alpha/beta hydrolase [Clostridia bacterium]|nr:alpha/beta hydrolase [Clostridia bacterium]